jgi:hypothetical protein
MSRAPLEQRARHLAHGFLRAAARLEAADVAVVLAGAIEERRAVVDRCAPCGQHLARRADIDVPLVVIGEVLPRERAVSARGFVEHRDMRLDPVLIDQPAEHLGRAVGAIAGEPGRIEVEAVHRPLDHALAIKDWTESG